MKRYGKYEYNGRVYEYFITGNLIEITLAGKEDWLPGTIPLNAKMIIPGKSYMDKKVWK